MMHTNRTGDDDYFVGGSRQGWVSPLVYEVASLCLVRTSQQLGSVRFLDDHVVDVPAVGLRSLAIVPKTKTHLDFPSNVTR
jgi:hypothetical protein